MARSFDTKRPPLIVNLKARAIATVNTILAHTTAAPSRLSLAKAAITVKNDTKIAPRRTPTSKGLCANLINANPVNKVAFKAQYAAKGL